MRGFERALEWLRPFVDGKRWDFCVVWKLGDDPSRFIEWKGCCCSGGVIVKVERDELLLQQQQQLGPSCRDAHFLHPIRSKACEALSRFPLFMSLYAGENRIHGEVAMSNQPKWVIHANASGSHSSHETGTQVLIPVFGGLIELFASKHIPEDRNIIELVTTQCNALLGPEVMAVESYGKACLDKLLLNTVLKKDLQNLPFAINLSSLMPRIQAITPVSGSSSPLSLDGSSTGSGSGSGLSVEHPPVSSGSAYVSQDERLNQRFGAYYGTKRLRLCKNLSEQQAELVLGCKVEPVEDKMETTKQLENENYHSKNLVTERNRRKRIKEGLFKLRALVPKISNMDRTAIVNDAIEYIGDLEKEEKKLRDELRKIEEENCAESIAELKCAKLDRLHNEDSSAVEQNQGPPSLAEKAKQEIHVEVNQINKREFLIKIYHEHKRGGFAKLMERIHSLGLQVIDANVTTFHGKVLNIFKAEGFSIQETERLIVRPINQVLLQYTEQNRTMKVESETMYSKMDSQLFRYSCNLTTS